MEDDRLSNLGWHLLIVDWTKPAQAVVKYQSPDLQMNSCFVDECTNGISWQLESGFWILAISSMNYDTTVESCSMYLQSGRESGPVIGHLINKANWSWFFWWLPALAPFFPFGTYPKFLASTLIFPPRQKGLDLSWHRMWRYVYAVSGWS